ncbi:uncharacterized protein LOC131685640 [Topomyia yanbarensis]|uniref:uncharacterized protein LOC131685640 n=1 Tax=Topomyia yanbarensis TaxID=2498891 RepID=UPI00273B1468|nr:uncharacterized protein LOC131685640 [Topomyia yanbarensis]XP_058825484.1 uncharacterized protein LOC131685640 [Topomyia yanbarensis]
MSKVEPDLPTFVKESVDKTAQELGFTHGRCVVSFEAGSKCDGLVGEIHQATITEGDRSETLFCKIPPLDPIRREQFNSMKLFEREVTLYCDVLPAMFKFQREKGISEEEGFFNVPKCYATHLNLTSEESLILMENLRIKNFGTCNKLQPIDYDHARLLMIHLGRFHGLSLAMKDQQPDLFEKFKLPDVLLPSIQANPMLVEMFISSLDNAISLLDAEDQEAISKMEALKTNYMEIAESCLSGKNAEPYAVLNHGDCWVNNIMYRYKDGQPHELMLIDWQLARYVSPALDILYFLLCCTDEAFREKYHDEMLQIYHSSMVNLLDRLGSDGTELFPFSALQDQLKRFGQFVIIMGAFDIPILCTDPAEMPAALDGDLSEVFATSPEAQQRYAGRMLGVMRDAIRYGYL